MTYKILLIDDSITQLEMLKRQLTKANFDVITAKDGGEGYQKVFETAPDLILSDIMMPNLNGYQLCRLLKNNPGTKEIPVILLTVLDKKIDKFWGRESGADKFISKTADCGEIEQTAKKLIEKNPISQKYKEELLSSPVNKEAVQNQINGILDELLMNSTFLNEFRDLGEFLNNEKVLVEKIFTLLGSFVDYSIAGLFFKSPDKNEKNIIHLDLNKNSVSGFVLERIKREFFQKMPNLLDFKIRDFGHNVFRETVENDELILNLDEYKTAHIVPFIANGNLVGGICFYNKDVCNYPAFKFYKTMISELFLLFKMRYLYSETQYLSVTDGLTGLYNRRHFEYNIELEFLRTKRYPSDLSVAMVDIDHFKRINDNYGHQFGDYALKEISNLISTSFRKTDMIYRYGGEEIAIILTETSLENALISLERLRSKIAQRIFLHNDEEVNITISIGVSASNDSIQNQHELVENADKALYRAKQSGRNKVVAYNHEESGKVLQ